MDSLSVVDELFLLADPRYKKFMSGLLPTVSKDRIIGVRMPLLRKIARKIQRAGRAAEFFDNLPNTYYEEDAICVYILSELEYDECISGIKRFLPFIDNWGICDSLRPTSFSDNKAALLREIFAWLSSKHTYTVRFAIEMLMIHFLDADFSPEIPKRLTSIKTGVYYIDMMVAWYFATALSKRYEEILPFLTERQLSVWIHNKAISKATESRRISAEKKEFLKSLKIKKDVK